MWFAVAHRFQFRPNGARAVPLLCDKTVEVGRKLGGPLSEHVSADKSISKHQFELAVAHNDPTDLSLQLDVLPTTPALHVVDRSGKETTWLDDKPIKNSDTPVRIQHIRSSVRAGKRGATFTLVWIPVVLVVDSGVLSKDQLDPIHTAADMLGLKVAMDHWDAQATHVVVPQDIPLTPVQTLAIQLGAIPVDPSWVLTLAHHTDPIDMDEPDDIVTALQAAFFRVQPSRKVSPDSLLKKPLNGQTLVLDSSLAATLSDPHRTALGAILTHLGAQSVMDATPADQLPTTGFLTVSSSAQPSHDLGQPLCPLDTLLNAVATGTDILSFFTRPPPSQGLIGSLLPSSLPRASLFGTSSLLRSQGASGPRSSQFGPSSGGLMQYTFQHASGVTQGGASTPKFGGRAGQGGLLLSSLGSGVSLASMISKNNDRSQPLASSLFSSATQSAKPPGSMFGKTQPPPAGKTQPAPPKHQSQSTLGPSLADQLGKAGSLSELGLHVPKKAVPPPTIREDSPLSDLQDTPPPAAGPLPPLPSEREGEDGGDGAMAESQADHPDPTHETEEQPEPAARELSQGDKPADPVPDAGSAGAVASVRVVKLLRSMDTGPHRSSGRSDPRNVKPFRKRWPLSPPDSNDDDHDSAHPTPRPHVIIRMSGVCASDASQPQPDSLTTSPQRRGTFELSTLSTPPVRAERTRFLTLDDDSENDDDDAAGAYVIPPSPRSPPVSAGPSAPPSPQLPAARGKRRRRLMDSDDDEHDELLESAMVLPRALPGPPVPDREAGAVGGRGARKRRKLLDSP